MRIIGALWTDKVNQYIIKCECDKSFIHRSDRFRVNCPKCNKLNDLSALREQYVVEQAAFLKKKETIDKKYEDQIKAHKGNEEPNAN